MKPAIRVTLMRIVDHKTLRQRQQQPLEPRVPMHELGVFNPPGTEQVVAGNQRATVMIDNPYPRSILLPTLYLPPQGRERSQNSSHF
jgi:hypothetical protein